jgi:hypothetical protein
MYVMFKLRLKIGIFLIVLGMIAACGGGPELERTSARQRATLSGTFFTESPDELIFPVKVLFAIDCSGSMGAAGEGSDPYNQRLAATWEFVERYNSNPNVSFEIILWNSTVFETTMVGGYSGFTKDANEIQSVLSNVVNTSMTDYVGTIESIYQDVYRDISNTDNHDSLVRTKYIVIFFSDGLDNVPTHFEPRTTQILNTIDDLYDMTNEFGVGSLNFHTFLLPGINMTESDRNDCIDLMSDMAEHGHGQFRVFETADTIDFISIVDMRLTAEYQVKYLVAYNFNVIPGIDTLFIDSDGDGLSDEEELNPPDYWFYATDPHVADTDGDGWSDYFEYKISTLETVRNPTVPEGACDALPDGSYPDSDYDGLNDCEEFYKGTNAFHPDTDYDGIPDSVEFYAGTNPLEDQTTMDMDFDGVADWYEVQRHTNVRANDPIVRERYAYEVSIEDLGFDPNVIVDGVVANVRRYDFSISNIAIMETGGSFLNGDIDLEPGDNVIRLFIAQVPEDMPDQLPIFRMAEVVINFDDPTRSAHLYPADFQLLE